MEMSNMATGDIYPTMVTGRTAIGLDNHVNAILHGSTYIPKLNCTLNSLYDVSAGEAPTAGTVPKVGWFGIGINGHQNITDKNSTAARPVKADNLNLYTHIPFVLVPLNEDKQEYRLKYRMRAIVNINSTMHVAYYLKPFELYDASVRIVRIDPNTQKEIVYELNPDNLRPVAPSPQTSDVVGATTEIQVYQRFTLPISGSEVAYPVAALYDGDLTMARLSEYGLYTGEEKVVTGYDSNNTAFQYTEVICAQLAWHTCTSGTDASQASSVLNRMITMSGGNLLTMD